MQVAEVRSRFEGAEGGLKAFVNALKELGLDCRQMDQSNKMFVMMEFRKSGHQAKPSKGDKKGGGRGPSNGGEIKEEKPVQFAAKVSWE